MAQPPPAAVLGTNAPVPRPTPLKPKPMTPAAGAANVGLTNGNPTAAVPSAPHPASSSALMARPRPADEDDDGDDVPLPPAEFLRLHASKPLPPAPKVARSGGRLTPRGGATATATATATANSTVPSSWLGPSGAAGSSRLSPGLPRVTPGARDVSGAPTDAQANGAFRTTRVFAAADAPLSSRCGAAHAPAVAPALGCSGGRRPAPGGSADGGARAAARHARRRQRQHPLAPCRGPD